MFPLDCYINEFEDRPQILNTKLNTKYKYYHNSEPIEELYINKRDYRIAIKRPTPIIIKPKNSFILMVSPNIK